MGAVGPRRLKTEGGQQVAGDVESGIIRPADSGTQRCLLCRIAGGDVKVDRLYEDEFVVVFDIPPDYPWRQAPVHFLAISREHIPSANKE